MKLDGKTFIPLDRCGTCEHLGNDGEQGYPFPVCYERPSLGNLKSFPFKKKMVCHSLDRYLSGLNGMPLPKKHPENDFMKWLLEDRHLFHFNELAMFDCAAIEFNRNKEG